MKPDRNSPAYKAGENIMRKRLAPGLWEDENGNPHWSIPELLAYADLPDTPETQAAVAEMLETMLKKELGSGLRIVHRARPDPGFDRPEAQ